MATTENIADGASTVVVERLSELTAHARRVAVAIGVFDGVHRGHQAIFRELATLCADASAEPVAMFFEPHPRAVLQPETAPLRILSSEDRIEEIRRLGIRLFVRFPFTKELAAQSPQEFFERELAETGLDICGYCVGENWRFGCRNSGDAATLRRLSGVDVRIVPSLLQNGLPVSSTRIRKALADGDMELVEAMMGRPYCLHGTVRHGQGKGGAELSYPTANLTGGGVQLPKFGVYAARGASGGAVRDGIVYVGDAPTLRGGSVLVEFHAFDFKGDLYGKELKVEFVEFLRPSVKFDDSEALKRQIEADVVRARHVLERKGEIDKRQQITRNRLSTFDLGLSTFGDRQPITDNRQ